MSGAQFPLWVTYSLAVIAILGPIGGALFGAWLTARRDDRRWDREVQREDLRWQREHERTQEQNAHDLAKHWTTERLELFGEIHHVLCEWRELFFAYDDVHFDGSESHLKHMDDLRLQLGPLLVRLPLVASAELIEIIRDIEDHYDSCRLTLAYRIPDEPVDTRREEFEEMVSLMKKELGLDPEYASRGVIR